MRLNSGALLATGSSQRVAPLLTEWLIEYHWHILARPAEQLETLAEMDLLKLLNGYWKGVFLYWERLIVILNPNPATETSENKKKILESTVWNSRYMFCFVSSIPNLQKRRSFKWSWTIKLMLWGLYEICTHYCSKYETWTKEVLTSCTHKPKTRWICGIIGTLDEIKQRSCFPSTSWEETRRFSAVTPKAFMQRTGGI